MWLRFCLAKNMAVKFDFDPMKLTGVKVPKADREDALDEVATFVKEQILSKTAAGETSVKRGRWKRELSPEYKKIKKEESSSGFANLELSGDMLDALDTAVVGRRVRIEITDESQEGKAEGNLLGSYGGEPNRANAREFMPQGNQELAPDIMAGVKQILKRYEDK